MKKKTYFELDWRYSTNDLIWNIERIVGKIPVKYVRDDMSYGDDVEILKAEGKEFMIKIDDGVSLNSRLEGELALINKYLAKKHLKIVDLGQEDDTLRFEVASV